MSPSENSEMINEYDAAVAAFIRAKGITRCPTACALPTQGTIGAADRTALQKYVIARAVLRQSRIAARRRLSSMFRPPQASDH
jgi:hypothetical protein